WAIPICPTMSPPSSTEDPAATSIPATGSAISLILSLTEPNSILRPIRLRISNAFARKKMTVIHYSEEPPNTWSALLDRARREGATTVKAPVLWGAHEAMQGVRDFHKTSRLHLERFLNLAQEKNLGVILVVGFPRARETYPAWTLELPLKTWIPSAAWLRTG